MVASNLALFWVAVTALAILIYVVLDGFDLGIGVLFGTTREEPRRVEMMNTIAPFWDGNETWLIAIGVALFAAFPMVYVVFLGAFYIPVVLLLLGLVFRGVAFEFRFRAQNLRAVWDWGFFLGSVVVAFVQGAAVGAMIKGIPVENGQYAGGPLLWLAPFPIMTGIGLVFGYALLGACWLVVKSEDPLREWAYRRIPWLAGGAVVILALAFVFTDDGSGFAHSNLKDRTWALVFPAIGLLALIWLFLSARSRKNDYAPFAATVVMFICAFLVLAAMFWPFMIPYSITVADAAAPDASLEFLFYGCVIAIPVVLLYTIGVYWVFRGKTHKGYG